MPFRLTLPRFIEMIRAIRDKAPVFPGVRLPVRIIVSHPSAHNRRSWRCIVLQREQAASSSMWTRLPPTPCARITVAPVGDPDIGRCTLGNGADAILRSFQQDNKFGPKPMRFD